MSGLLTIEDLARRWRVSVGAAIRHCRAGGVPPAPRVRPAGSWGSGREGDGVMARHRGGTRRIYDPRGVPSDEEQRELARRARAGDEDARNELVARNYGIAAMVAGRYGGTPEWQEDLAQEGVFGLIRAARDYDPDRPAKYITYAAFWVRHYIVRYIADRAGVIRIPFYLHGRKGEEHHLAPHAAAARRVGSLDAPGEEGIRGVDRLESPGVAADEAALDAEDRELAARLAAAVDDLGDDVADIVRSLYGLGGREPESLKAIGERRGRTRERMRQLNVSALRRLRAMAGA